MDLQTGDIVARTIKLDWSPLSWISALIRVFAHVRYEHVSHIVVENNIPMIYRTSVRKKYYKMPAADFLPTLEYEAEFIVYRPTYSAFDSNKFAAEANRDLGASYDFLGLLQQFFWNVLGIWISRSEERISAHFHCYERMWYLHRACKTFTIWFMSKPADLFNNKYGDFRKLSENEYLNQTK